MQDSWPKPVPPEYARARTIKLITCARCRGRLYHTKLKGQPRQEDHPPGCEGFIEATRVAQYAEEMKRAAADPKQGGWRSNRRWRKYLLENAKKMFAAACEGDPVAAVRVLSDQYEAESEADDASAETKRLAVILLKACGRLALGEAPAPIVSRPR